MVQNSIKEKKGDNPQHVQKENINLKLFQMFKLNHNIIITVYCLYHILAVITIVITLNSNQEVNNDLRTC